MNNTSSCANCNNIILFTVPVVNMVVRHGKEKRIVEAMGRCLPTAGPFQGDEQAVFRGQIDLLNAQRAVVQKEFLIGLALQVATAVASLALFFLFSVSGVAGVIPLALFCLLGINASISLPFHFFSSNFTFRVTSTLYTQTT